MSKHREIVISDIDCAQCMMRIGITDGFVNLAWCSDECRKEWLDAQEEERNG